MLPVFRICAIGLLLALSAEHARAQAQEYPNRAVSFIVPFAPGGVTGLFARLLGQKLEQRLGKPFVVEHRPGGGGVTAAVGVARAAPDGYTIMMASSTVLAINVTVRKNLPYDPRTDLTPIALLARVPFVLVVNPALPVHSVADLVKLAKEKPGQLSFGTPGPGTFHHLNAELFKTIFGLELVHVPYKGTAPALTDVMGGHISAMVDALPSTMPHVKSGKLKPLAVTTAQRVAALPDVPTVAESGIDGFEMVSWYGLWAPANLPPDLAARLQQEVAKALKSPQVAKALLDYGFVPSGSTPAEFKAYIRQESAKYAKLIKAANIRLEN
jgi:tripartite-type tricarboxylate transporter receptor subunit TctC